MSVTNAATKSWKTTTLGILAFLTVGITAAQALLDADPATIPDWNVVVTAGVTAIALIVARDNDVTSAAAGAEK